LECMTIDRNQVSDYLDKIARFLIDSGSVKTDDMVQEEVPDYVVEAVTTLRSDLAALNARVEELERVRKIASEIFIVVSTGGVVRTAQACKHGNYATAPHNHAWWCDECFWELEAALKGQIK